MDKVWLVYAIDEDAEYAEMDFVAGVFQSEEKAQYFVEKQAEKELGKDREIVGIYCYPVF